ncbi:MAG: hypothetical protein MZU97_26315 [Bacillus subtilis]|nr:hypothetical protein [Bacillus subtilis]
MNASGIDGNSTVAVGLVLGDASVTKGPYEVINCYSSSSATVVTVGSSSSSNRWHPRRLDAVRHPGVLSFQSPDLEFHQYLAIRRRVRSDASNPEKRRDKHEKVHLRLHPHLVFRFGVQSRNDNNHDKPDDDHDATADFSIDNRFDKRADDGIDDLAFDAV